MLVEIQKKLKKNEHLIWKTPDISKKLWNWNQGLSCERCIASTARVQEKEKYMWIGVGRDSFIANTGGVGMGSRNKHMAYKKISTVYSFVKINGFVSIWS